MTTVRELTKLSNRFIAKMQVLRLPCKLTPYEYRQMAERDLECAVRIVQVVSANKKYRRRVRLDAWTNCDLAVTRANLCRSLHP